MIERQKGRPPTSPKNLIRGSDRKRLSNLEPN